MSIRNLASGKKGTQTVAEALNAAKAANADTTVDTETSAAETVDTTVDTTVEVLQPDEVGAGINFDEDGNESVPQTIPAEAKEVTAKPKKKTKTPKKKAKPRKSKINEEWLAVLKGKVNDKFSDLIDDGHEIDFAVARYKTRMVSLTPKIVNKETGVCRSAGSGHRVGFCTDGKWDDWFDSVRSAINCALEKSTAKSNSSRNPLTLALQEGLPDMNIKGSGNKITLNVPGREEEIKVRLNGRGDTITKVTTANGPIDEIFELVLSIKKICDKFKSE